MTSFWDLKFGHFEGPGSLLFVAHTFGALSHSESAAVWIKNGSAASVARSPKPVKTPAEFVKKYGRATGLIHQLSASHRSRTKPLQVFGTLMYRLLMNNKPSPN